MTNNPVSELGDLLNNIIDRKLLDVRTSMPAIVQSYDAATQTAEVTIAIRRRLKNGQLVEPIKLPNVRVIFPASGNFSMRFPLQAGDGVLLIFHERDIDAWRTTGNVGEPFTNRHFSLSDVVAIAGYHADTNLPEFDAGDDGNYTLYFGDVKIVLTADGKILLGKKGSTQDEPLVLGNVMKACVTDIIAALDVMTDDLSSNPVAIGNAGTPTPPSPQLIATMTTLKSALATALSTYVTDASTNIVSQVSFTERGV